MSNNLMDRDRELKSAPPAAADMDQLDEFRKELETAVSRNEALLGALRRRAQQPPAWFIPDGTIQLLPASCGIRLDAGNRVPVGGGNLFLEGFYWNRPRWQTLPMPTHLVGKVKATFTAAQYRDGNLGRRTEQLGRFSETSSQSQAAESTPVILLVVDPPTPTAGRDVFLLPKATAPYYDFVTDEDIIINIDDVEINSDADDEVKRLEIMATLLEDWDAALDLQFSTFAHQARIWRMERREWELATVQKIFLAGYLDMLASNFGISDLVNARQFVDMQNELEQVGEVKAWEYVWDEDSSAAAVEHKENVNATMYRVKRILYQLIPEDERGLERNCKLVGEMAIYAQSVEESMEDED
ncbi:uncharacterized protein N7496_000421 [Penicillium cataractarum]|uniref:Uncharacterized protein n=1 Tax=Penicillium cataractarum TaxID=2100454 RepID=A0A9W9VU33_9EURO|nr:uncharacterized protein N7496_000421 [Penicillium cataractarum]KAJ5389353.1 hypothetical protein N7496_000421 [Penicillium cataractarum]